MIRLNILISAHELSPFMGSECAIGWNIVLRLSKYHNITVIYAETNQAGTVNYSDNINKFFKLNGKPTNIEFISFPQPSITKVISKINYILFRGSAIGLPLIYHIIYRKWQKNIFSLAKKLISTKKYDLIHHLTSINFREPGYLWKLKLPFVWGPTGGTTKLVSGYYRYLDFTGKLSESLRNLSVYYLLKYSPKVKNAIRNSDLVYIFSLADKEKIKKIFDCNLKILLDTGSYLNISRFSNYERKKNIQGIWCGQIIKRKAPEILIKAFAEAQKEGNNIQMAIIPNGILPDKIKEFAENLGVRNIKWYPYADHDKVLEIMAESDFLVHTSYREATTAIIPEALSVGLPVICHDISGMGIAINENCGIKIPLVDPEKSIIGFRDAMLFLANNPDELERLKKGARERAMELSWDIIADTIASDYLDIIQKSGKN